MGDRYNIHSQLEHLQSKYIGTGHADTTKWEWVTNQHRDTYASYLVSSLFLRMYGCTQLCNFVGFITAPAHRHLTDVVLYVYGLVFIRSKA